MGQVLDLRHAPGRFGKGAQKIRRRARPLRPLLHHRADSGSDRIGLDHVINHLVPVATIGRPEGTGRPDGGLAGRCPQGKIRHSGQPFQRCIGEHLQALNRRVEQRAQNARTLGVERGPQFRLGAALLLWDGLQGQEHRPVGQIGPGHGVLDAVQDHWAGRVEQHLVLVGVELPNGETTAGGQPAERI